MQQTRWIRRTAAVGLIALMTSGCALLESGEEKRAIDPPQGPEVSQVSAGVSPESASAAEAQYQLHVTLYAKDPNGYLAPVTLGIPKTESIAKSALELMVAGGPAETRMPAGFSPVLPEGTIVKGINILKEQKTAVVDLSKEFAQYDARDERKVMEALTWTLTGFPTVDNVQLWVEGKLLKEMPAGKTPINEPLNRAMGINLELENGVDYGKSTPVTLYFVGQTERDETYFVPVTRLVGRTDDPAMTAMKQLIQGPGANGRAALHAPMAPDAEVLNVKLSEDKSLVTVNFSEHLLGPDQKASAEALQSVILSITENTGASQVQIMVNGKAQVSGSDNQSYAKPVNRPTQINPFKL